MLGCCYTFIHSFIHHSLLQRPIVLLFVSGWMGRAWPTATTRGWGSARVARRPDCFVVVCFRVEAHAWPTATTRGWGSARVARKPDCFVVCLQGGRCAPGLRLLRGDGGQRELPGDRREARVRRTVSEVALPHGGQRPTALRLCKDTVLLDV